MNCSNTEPERGSSPVTGKDPSAGRNKRSVWSIDDEKALFDWLAANYPETLSQFLTEATSRTPNRKDVWRIVSEGYPGAHFATFPPDLVEPCLLAGTSERGACPKCGAAWDRVIESRKLKRKRPNDYVKRTGEAGTGNSCANTVAGVDVKTLGWQPRCGCYGLERFPEQPVRPGQKKGESDDDYAARLTVEWEPKAVAWREAWERVAPQYSTQPAVPCVVLDPFIGSGTTCVVALEHGRRSIGIDLSEKYLRRNAVPRIEGALLSRGLGHLAGRETQAVSVSVGEELEL